MSQTFYNQIYFWSKLIASIFIIESEVNFYCTDCSYEMYNWKSIKTKTASVIKDIKHHSSNMNNGIAHVWLELFICCYFITTSALLALLHIPSTNMWSLMSDNIEYWHVLTSVCYCNLHSAWQHEQVNGWVVQADTCCDLSLFVLLNALKLIIRPSVVELKSFWQFQVYSQISWGFSHNLGIYR